MSAIPTVLVIVTPDVLEDIARVIHAPSILGEAFQEATLTGLGYAIHISE